MGDSNTDRTAPDVAFIDHKSGQKVLVIAGRHTVFQSDANDLTSSATGAIPRTMKRSENLTSIGSRECGWSRHRSRIKRHL